MFKIVEKSFIVAILMASVFLVYTNKARADNFNFDPNFIISDAEVLDSSAMNLDDIQSFLTEKGGYLATYSTFNFEGKFKTAAQIIYDAAANNTNYDCDGVLGLSDSPTTQEMAQKCLKVKINPKFLLVLVQKEQSLVDDPSPKESQLDWATGYGCPDSGGCSERWKGFGKQINSAALQFFSYMVHPEYYQYKANGTYVLSNPYSASGTTGNMSVTPLNQATAALYNYTPHVYNGNYNFYKTWQRWFTRLYPDGTLLQSNASTTVWLIQDSKKRPFVSMGALLSRYDLKKIIMVNDSDLQSYSQGAPIKFPQYSLVRSPKGTIYLLVDDTKHGIASKEVFRRIGFNSIEVVKGSWEDLNAYKEGVAITATTTYPVGALLQDKKTGGVYWVIDNKKAPIQDKVFLTTKFRNKQIKVVTSKELNKYATATPVLFGDGELLTAPGSPGVFIIDGGKKRPFASAEIFEALGYDWGNIISVPMKILDMYPFGDPIMIVNRGEDVNPNSTSTPDNLTGTSTPGISTSSPSDLSSTSTLTNLGTGTTASASSTN